MERTYDEIYSHSLEDPECFWANVVEAVHWYKKWDVVLDDSRKPFYQWFSGGVVNTCYNALDLHVENGRGDQPALIYDSPLNSTVETFTYRELLSQVTCFAGVLNRPGRWKR